MSFPNIRIFISSPGDVADEREKARRVVDDLQRVYTGAVLQSVLWEDLALPATASFQESIDYLLGQKAVDVAVFILWSRLGTPLGAAVTRPDGTPYRSGTEREFDLMLEAFERSGRKRPILLAYTRDDDAGFRRVLAQSPRDRLEELLEQRKLAETFIREQFFDAEGRSTRALHSYREPVSFAQRLRTHLHAVLGELLGVEAEPRWLSEPYRGLEPFHVEHAPIFHGRDEETCDLLQRLREQQQAGSAFVVIVGASGAGKSSLARAGVAATLAGNPFDDARLWRIATLIPGLGEGTPTIRLARALCEALPELAAGGTTPDDIATGLSRDPELTAKLSLLPAFTRAAEQIGEQAGDSGASAGNAVRLLIVIDQLEELWTDRRITPDDRAQFMAAIEALAKSGPIALLATLRSDFYPHAQLEPGFVRLKGERGHYDLLPPGTTALGRLITEPAKLAGVRFEREMFDERSGRTNRSLDEVILHDAARDPSALPLLQYTLSELYRQSDPQQRLLTFAAYEQLGGVEGALGKRAAEVFSSLPADSQTALQEILPRLVTIDITGDEAATRRRAPLTELTSTSAAKQLTESLIAARFLTTDRDENNQPIAGLAHEALLRRWPQLQEWVTANREHLRRRTRVEQSQRRWEQEQENQSLLLPPGLPLEEARQLLDQAEHLLHSDTAGYVRASIADEQLLRARRKRGQMIAVSTAAASSMILITAVVVGWYSLLLADKNEELQAGNSALNTTNEELSRQRDVADKARLDAQTSETEKSRLQRATEYAAKIGIAAYDLRRELPFQAARGLGESDQELRGWEVNHLIRQCTQMVDSEQLAHTPMPAISSDERWRVVAVSDGPESVKLIGNGDARKWSTRPKVITATTPETSTVEVLTAEMNSLIHSFCVSGDATLLAVGTSERIQLIKLVDLETARQLKWDAKKEADIESAAAGNQRAKRLVQHFWASRPTLTPQDRPDELLVFNGPSSIRFSRDSRRLAVGGHPGRVEVFAVDSDSPIANWQHGSSTVGVCFSPDGSRVCSASWGGGVVEREVVTKKVVRTYDADGFYYACEVSPNGRFLAAARGSADPASDGGVKVWSREDGKLAFEVSLDSHCEAVVFSQDGRDLFVGSEKGRCLICDVSRKALRKTVIPYDSLENPVMMTGIIPAPEGGSIHTINTSGSFATYDVSSARDVLRIKSADGISDICEAGSKAFQSHFNGKVMRLDAATGRYDKEAVIKNAAVTAMAVIGENEVLLSVDRFGAARPSVMVWDAESNNLTPFSETRAAITSMCARSDDHKMFVTGDVSGNVEVWERAKRKPVKSLAIGESPVAQVLVSEDGRWIAACTGRSLTLPDENWISIKQHPASLVVWNSKTGDEHFRSETLGHCMAISADGRFVVAATDSRILELWDLDSKSMLRRLTGHDGRPSSLSFSPDSRRIASSGDRGEILIWDVTTALPLLILETNTEAVRRVRFSRSGDLLYSFSERELQIWNGDPNFKAAFTEMPKREDVEQMHLRTTEPEKK